MIKDLFRPRWRHSDPEVRRLAVEAMGNDQQTLLAELVTQDQDAGVRSAACRKLRNLDLVWSIYQSDDTVLLRNIALSRLRKLLTEVAPEGADADQQLHFLQRHTVDELLSAVIAEAGDARLRRLAIELTNQDDLLADRALHDTVLENRLLAAEKLQDLATLERVARGTKSNQKRIYRLVRDRIKLLQDEAQRRREARERGDRLLDQLPQLGLYLPQLSQDRARYQRVLAEWETLRGHFTETDPVAFHDRSAAAERRLVALQQLADAGFGALHAAEAPTPPAVADSSDESAPTPSVQETSAVDIPAPTAEAAESRPIHDDCLDWCAQVRARLDGQPLPALYRERWARRHEQLARAVLTEDSRRALDETWQLLRQQINAQELQVEQLFAGLSERLDEFEKRLDQGALKPATPLFSQLRQEMDYLEQIEPRRLKASGLASRWRACQPIWRELSQWRRWSGDAQRDQLRVDMEQLKNADLPGEQRYHRLQRLQSAWRLLDQSGAPCESGVREQFQTLSDQVFALCQPYLQQLSAGREAAREAREALCSQLETFLTQADWRQMDWKRAQRACHELQESWRSLGETDFRSRKRLQQRYQRAMAQLEARLDDERRNNQALKEQLIGAAEALMEQPDHPQILGELKQLHQRWRTTVSGSRGQENRFWQRFKQAGDAVAERHEAALGQEQAKWQAHQERLQQLLNELAALAERELDLSSLNQALDPLLQTWHELWDASQLAPRERHPLQKRWDTLRKRIDERRHRLMRQERSAGLEPLRETNRWLVELEAQVFTANAHQDTATWRQSWATLNPDERSGGAALAARYHIAIQALEGDPDAMRSLRAQSAAHRQRLEHLCLEAEILAGLESPAEYAEQRLGLQVARLSESFRQAPRELDQSFLQLEQDWCVVGAVESATARDHLQQRFDQARRKVFGP